MDKRDNGASAMHDDGIMDWEQSPGDGRQDAPEDTEDVLGRELAAYAFLREEDDREVRLHFRDVPADGIALAFRRAGALFISMTGERARMVQATPIAQVDPAGMVVSEEMPPLGRRRRKRKGDPGEHGSQDEQALPSGELTIRYFYATETLLYTIIIAKSAGIVESISSIYPSGKLLEGELQRRLGAVFR